MRRAEGSAAAAGPVGISIRRAAVVWVIFSLAATAPAVPAASEPTDDPPDGKAAASARSPASGIGTGVKNDAARVHVRRGVAALEKGDNDAAIAEFTEAIRLDPRGAGAFSNRSAAWMMKNEFDKALADLNEAVRLEPRNARIFVNRGGIWLKKGHHGKAIADCNEAIRLDPSLAAAFISRGSVWEEKKDLDKALADLNEAIRLEPRFAVAYCNRGGVWIKKREPDKAIADLNEAIRLDPRDAAALANRARVWEALGQPDRAITDFAEAARLGARAPNASRRTESPPFDANKARAYATLGNTLTTDDEIHKAFFDPGRTNRVEPRPTVAPAERPPHRLRKATS